MRDRRGPLYKELILQAGDKVKCRIWHWQTKWKLHILLVFDRGDKITCQSVEHLVMVYEELRTE